MVNRWPLKCLQFESRGKFRILLSVPWSISYLKFLTWEQIYNKKWDQISFMITSHWMRWKLPCLHFGVNIQHEKDVKHEKFWIQIQLISFKGKKIQRCFLIKRAFQLNVAYHAWKQMCSLNVTAYYKYIR